MLYSTYIHPETFLHVSRRRDGSKNKPLLEDILDLLQLRYKLNLSTEQSTMILQTIKNINQRNEITLCLPASYKSINHMFNKKLFNDVNVKNYVIPTQNCFSIVNYEYKLDTDFFPNLQERTTKAYSFNIMEILSEQLLNVDPGLF
jgi:hypothetical protein